MSKRIGQVGRWENFKAANTRFCINIWNSGFTPSEEVIEAFRLHPFAWTWMLIPICGVIGFYEVGDSVRWENRVKRFEERRARNKRSTDP